MTIEEQSGGSTVTKHKFNSYSDPDARAGFEKLYKIYR